MTPHPAVLAIADALRDLGEQAKALADGLERGLAPNVPPSRLVMLAAPALALAAELERELHRLQAFTLRPPAAS